MQTSFFYRLNRWLINLLVFLMPLFFLPFTQEVLEMNKQVLLVVFTVLGLVTWMIMMFGQKQVSVRSGWVNLLPALFLVGVWGSAVHSKMPSVSWIGGSSQEYMGVIASGMFVALFFMLTNQRADVREQRSTLVAFFLSALISGILCALSLFQVFVFPFSFTQTNTFNTVGSFGSLVLFVTIISQTGLALLVASSKEDDDALPFGFSGMILRVLLVLLFVLNLFLLIVLNYWVLWVINIVSVFLLASFGFLRTKEFPTVRRFGLPLFSLLISLFFLFLPTPALVKIPLQVSLSNSASWHVVQSTLYPNVPALLFGSGPGTFLNQFLLFKPVSMNSTILWQVAFDRAHSAFLTRLNDLGMFGTIAWSVLMVWIGILAIKKLLSQRDSETWKITYVLFVGWVLSLLGQFLVASNMTLECLHWVLSGMLLAQVLPKVWRADFTRSPKSGVFVSFVFVLVTVGLFGASALLAKAYAADVVFTQAVHMSQNKADAQSVIKELKHAASLNSSNDLYIRNVSFAQFQQASLLVRDLKGKQPTEEQSKQIVQYVSDSVQSGMTAARVSPNHVANWEVLGLLYRELMPFAQNAEDAAAQAYLNTARLDPTNPVHYVDLARVYLTVADRARALKGSKDAEEAKLAAQQEQNLLTTTEQVLGQAVVLKNDYLPAHYYLASVYERQGKLDEATARIAALSQAAPTDIGLGFELAQLEIRSKNYDAARQELERVVSVNPNYANALWYLASLYEIQNNHDKALELVKKVVSLNPDNKDAQDRLAKLQAGQVTTIIPEPIQSANNQDSLIYGPSAPTPAPESPKK